MMAKKRIRPIVICLFGRDGRTCGNHSHFTAQWQSLAQITQNQIRLVPEGLVTLLQLK